MLPRVVVVSMWLFSWIRGTNTAEKLQAVVTATQSLFKCSDSMIVTFGKSSVLASCFLQLNISFPATGCQKLIEVDDERKLRTFYEKRMATEVAADPLGDEWKVSVSTHQ